MGITALRVFLGALFCTVFFENVAFNRYTADGYQRLIDRYAAENDAPGFWSDGVMAFFAANSEVFAPLQFLTELGFGVLLVLGVATGIVALAAAGFLLMLWVSSLGLFWIWELLPIIALACVVGATSLPELRAPGDLRRRLLGRPTFGSLPLAAGLALAVAGGLVLAGLILAEGTGAGDNSLVAWRSGALFGVLLAICAVLDRLRGGTEGEEAAATPGRASASAGGG
jgi:uncharacterized membrane protein YphA (DoxX/SURF4 family)